VTKLSSTFTIIITILIRHKMVTEQKKKEKA